MEQYSFPHAGVIHEEAFIDKGDTLDPQIRVRVYNKVKVEIWTIKGRHTGNLYYQTQPELTKTITKDLELSIYPTSESNSAILDFGRKVC